MNIYHHSVPGPELSVPSVLIDWVAHTSRFNPRNKQWRIFKKKENSELNLNNHACCKQWSHQVWIQTRFCTNREEVRLPEAVCIILKQFYSLTKPGLYSKTFFTILSQKWFLKHRLFARYYAKYRGHINTLERGKKGCSVLENLQYIRHRLADNFGETEYILLKFSLIKLVNVSQELLRWR